MRDEFTTWAHSSFSEGKDLPVVMHISVNQMETT